MERCNISLSSLLSCGFPLYSDAPLCRAYSSTALLCVHASELLFFAFPVRCVCVFTSSDTRTTLEHSSGLTGITLCSHAEREVKNKKSMRGESLNSGCDYKSV